MAKFEIHVLYNKIPDIVRAVENGAPRVVEKAARDIEAYAKSVVPVDTGTLKNSIQAEREHGLLWIVAPHTDYAVYVEFGTRRMRPRPYMRPAAEHVREIFLKAMERLFS
jgi:HK97 gp10 family phage protein